MKKRMTWFLAILLVAVLVTGCSGRKNQDSGSEQSDGQQATIGEAKTSTEEDSHVLMVKNGCPSNYPDSPYGQVFEKYFENPSWGYFQAKDEKGNIVDIVEFTGDCEFENADYKAQIQFTVDDKICIDTRRKNRLQIRKIKDFPLSISMVQYRRIKNEYEKTVAKEERKKLCVELLDLQVINRQPQFFWMVCPN